ncbi:MAG: TrkH family potassium uptake protein [Clostridiaceae bacterium]|nr:TrkH family potassium uptake protein [Clostridiaceae bacterium]
MNTRMILKTLGFLLIIEAASMLPSLLVSLIYKGNDFAAFLITIVILLLTGVILYRMKVKNTNLYSRDGFAIVSIGWIMISLFGALPFILSGAIPSFFDAFFECVSGLTTTGSSILQDVEGLPKGILFWRSSTIWLGGMGVLVLTLAILPKAGATSFQIMKAESPGPNPDKLVPKIAQTAQILYSIYLGLTIVLTVLLIIAGMPVYDALIHAIGTAGTGGFSIKNLSVGSYNNIFIEVIITVFMFIFGINFALHYHVLKGNVKSIFKDEEFCFYTGTVIIAIILISVNLTGSVFNSVGESLRHASFQVTSVITTTGYSTYDFNQWPTFSKTILVILMFMGACAGSTSGGMKCIRIVVLLKTVKRELKRILHPRAVNTVKLSGRNLDDSLMSGVTSYFFAYFVVFVISILLISLDGKDLTTTFTSVTTTINNVGPGLGLVGPSGNFADYSDFNKFLFSFIMLFGRLEIFPMLLLFTPSFWRRANI